MVEDASVSKAPLLAVGNVTKRFGGLIAVSNVSFAVRAYDDLGALSQPSGSLDVLIDSKAPQAPTPPDLDVASDDGPASNDNVTSVGRAALSGQAEPDCLVEILIDGKVVGSTIAKSNSQWNFTVPTELAPAKYLISAIATDVASPHGMEERFTIEGPPVHLAPQTATAMALGLHELATNAAKYGALSAPEGRVALTWNLDGDQGGERRFSMTWRESGGPAVTPPETSGFGTRLIERGLAGELRAQTKLDYAAEGLVFTLVAPVGELLTEG